MSIGISIYPEDGQDEQTLMKEGRHCDVRGQEQFPKLKTLGIRFAIDDCGTGYTSLSQPQSTSDRHPQNRLFVSFAIFPGMQKTKLLLGRSLQWARAWT